MGVFDDVTDVWKKYTPAGVVYSKFLEPAVNTAVDTANNIGNTVSNVGNTVSNGVNTIKRYWYVPVIIGGVLVGYKLLNSAKNTSGVAKLLTNLI